MKSARNHFHLGRRVIKWHHSEMHIQPNLRGYSDFDVWGKPPTQRFEVPASFGGLLERTQSNSNP